MVYYKILLNFFLPFCNTARNIFLIGKCWCQALWKFLLTVPSCASNFSWLLYYLSLYYSPTAFADLTLCCLWFTETFESEAKMVESTPLRDRMAMYQAAVTKLDLSSSPTVSISASVINHSARSLSFHMTLLDLIDWFCCMVYWSTYSPLTFCVFLCRMNRQTVKSAVTVRSRRKMCHRSLPMWVVLKSAWN